MKQDNKIYAKGVWSRDGYSGEISRRVWFFKNGRKIASICVCYWCLKTTNVAPIADKYFSKTEIPVSPEDIKAMLATRSRNAKKLIGK
jgi:hypothetical protein